MAGNGVYQATTEQADGSKPTIGNFTIYYLGKPRFILKVLQLVFSFVAFLCEEIVERCTVCGPLYFFEFVSCCVFLFGLMMFAVECTCLFEKFKMEERMIWDYVFTAAAGAFFLIASIIFAAVNDGTSLESTAVAFGFLASLAFIVDIGYLIKTKGLPSMSQKESPTRGTDTASSPEEERLNTPQTA
ncbi:CKLF-like MARVEL transmembrane domain-containing protein 6 [Latimeria chalumnae]|uniref:CKLF like MARVEL transmembrane domain containing 6 n=1 Tax=Latimeria chalumnae TaxID=7897 RepID=H3AZK6_LATCH|nr:PREDICTED: CKLF-like MARVEL transmembrane domain-containing protein 6 [Latimeria chalumnae]|eukprot:XP_006000641.1 PREDICTED: CKLF-like MARVEL transmembrane domain-containing protein 6 [Latimeria chalumnae]